MGVPLGSDEQRIGKVGEKRETNAMTPRGPTNITVAIVKKWLCLRRLGKSRKISNDTHKLPVDGATTRGTVNMMRADEYVHIMKSRYRQSSLPRGPYMRRCRHTG